MLNEKPDVIKLVANVEFFMMANCYEMKSHKNGIPVGCFTVRMKQKNSTVSKNGVYCPSGNRTLWGRGQPMILSPTLGLSTLDPPSEHE